MYFLTTSGYEIRLLAPFCMLSGYFVSACNVWTNTVACAHAINGEWKFTFHHQAVRILEALWNHLQPHACDTPHLNDIKVQSQRAQPLSCETVKIWKIFHKCSTLSHWNVMKNQRRILITGWQQRLEACTWYLCVLYVLSSFLLNSKHYTTNSPTVDITIKQRY